MDFEQLYAQYFRDVHRFVLSLCRDHALAEELTQQTFFKALRSLDSFQQNCHVRTWLCSIAKNLYFSHLRRHKAQESADWPLPDAEGPEASLCEREETLRLHQHLHDLPEPYREVFTLRVFGDLGHAQIASVFGKSEAWARTTFYRAKLLLQQRIKGDKDEQHG